MAVMETPGDEKLGVLLPRRGLCFFDSFFHFENEGKNTHPATILVVCICLFFTAVMKFRMHSVQLNRLDNGVQTNSTCMQRL